MARKSAAVFVVASLAALALLLPAALGANGGGGKGKGGGGSGSSSAAPSQSSTTSGCAPSAPQVLVQNSYGWNQSGSWGRRGDTLGYQIQIIDQDSGCASSSFVMSVSAPTGFSVNVPTSTFSLKPGGYVYLWAYVTSPSDALDGDYPLTVSVARATAAGAAATTYYKVYSTDTTAPTLFWWNPADGATLSGSSYNVVVWSSDDHAVQRIELYIDGSLRSTMKCADVDYNCALSYKWSLRHARGRHTATFKSYDWMGNPAEKTVTFTVG
jgi:Bacterial Ig domain